MQDNLIEIISKKISLTENDLLLCSEYFEPVYPGKNTILEKQGKIPKYLYFIASGCMRVYYENSHGEEITSQLATKDQFVTSFLHFIHQTKSGEIVQCVTDCEILRISRPRLAHLIEISEKFKDFSLIIFEQAILSTQKRADDLANLPAVKRYRKLIIEQPMIHEYVPVQYIASYLGIKPQSLSRIRRQLRR